MDTHYTRQLSNFFAAGINYKKSDASVRGLFAVSNDQYATLLNNATQRGLSELFVLSTCNRTEIYGFAHSAGELSALLTSVTTGTEATFLQSAYIRTGTEAVQHLFEVGAGLDSQILGDYEIVGQLKTAVKFSKERGFVGAFTERLINSVLQASKMVKNKTALSGGTVSVSFAAVQFLRQVVPAASEKKVLLLGTGKIGRNTCRNLVDYLGTRDITLVNRTPEKAAALALELGLRSAPLSDLDAQVAAADIVLLATNSPEPVLFKKHLAGRGPKWIVDLSIPCNVEAGAGSLPGILLAGVDELSCLKDETLRRRQGEVPKALAILTECMAEFTDWCAMRQHVPLLRALKVKLRELQPLTQPATACPKKLDLQIQRVLNETAGKIRIQNQRGCQYITALTDFIKPVK